MSKHIHNLTVHEALWASNDVGPLMACNRSGMGALNGDLRRVLRRERKGFAFHPHGSLNCTQTIRILSPLHVPDQEARLIAEGVLTRIPDLGVAGECRTGQALRNR
jgi:hypothetical protein